MIIADGKLPAFLKHPQIQRGTTWGNYWNNCGFGLSTPSWCWAPREFVLSHQRVVSLLLRDFQLTKSGGSKTPAWIPSLVWFRVSYRCCPCFPPIDLFRLEYVALNTLSTRRFDTWYKKRLSTGFQVLCFFDVLCCVCFRCGYFLCLNEGEGSAIIYNYLTMFISLL